MAKVEAIIDQLQSRTFEQLPLISHVFDSDLERISQALKKQKPDRSYYAILRFLMSEVKKKLGHQDYTKPLFQISLNQIQGKPYFNDLRLRICEAVIQSQEIHRINLVEHTINEMTSQNITNPSIKVRLQIVRAGKQCFKGDFTKAAIYYSNASKMQCLIKDEEKKISLINKAIALCYVAPRNNENHKTICGLCLNELSQKSHLRTVLKKLYTEDILTNDQCHLIEKQLPLFLGNQDMDGISVLNQAKFCHNMTPIMNCFRTIKFNTLQRILSMQIDQVLILIQKTFNEGQIKIDQLDQTIEFIQKIEEGSQKLKELLNKIDALVENN